MLAPVIPFYLEQSPNYNSAVLATQTTFIILCNWKNTSQEAFEFLNPFNLVKCYFRKDIPICHASCCTFPSKLQACFVEFTECMCFFVVVLLIFTNTSREVSHVVYTLLLMFRWLLSLVPTWLHQSHYLMEYKCNVSFCMTLHARPLVNAAGFCACWWQCGVIPVILRCKP